MKVAVFGAGHGGIAITGDLTLAGHEVRLAAVPEHASNLELLKAFGGIAVEGMTSSGAPPGFAKPALMTTDLAAALRGAQVVLVVVPAFAQEPYMRALLAYGEKGQLVVFNPGKFGTLHLARLLREAGRAGDFLIGETSSLIFAARTKGLGHVRILGVKESLPFAAWPANRTIEMLWTLTDLYPQLTPSLGVLQTSIDAPGMILHPITTLLNMSRIEQMGPYRTAHYDITPSVARVMEAVDAERMGIAKILCREVYSFMDTMKVLYKVKGESAYDVMYQISAHNVLMAPDSMRTRYITEDVPYGLVSVASIGRQLGVPTPRLDAIINLACMANGEDYWTLGRSAETLGLAGMDAAAMARYALHGTPA
jgi:opine dehydrogenase